MESKIDRIDLNVFLNLITVNLKFENESLFIHIEKRFLNRYWKLCLSFLSLTLIHEFLY